MRVEFRDDELAQMETDPDYAGWVPRDVVRAFRIRMHVIRAALTEQDLYAFRGWRFKKLQGERAHQHTLRLNERWRLVLEIKKSSPSNTVVIVAIEK